MAHIGKFTATSLGRLFLHNNRKQGDGTSHQNEEIDDSRTHLNYHFVECNAKDIKKKLKEYYHQDRKDLIVLGEVTVTLPQDIREKHPEDDKKFFEECYKFFCKDFGIENVVNAVVHMDETTPHLHLDFLPVKPLEDRNTMTNCMRERIATYEAKNGELKGRLCAREVLNRDYYASFHTRLLEHMTKQLGYECGILNGATANGNKTLLQLKNESAAKKLQVAEQQVQATTAKLNYLNEQIEKMGFDKRYFDCPELFVYMDILEQENSLLKQIIKDENLQNKIPQDKFTQLKLSKKKIFEKTHFYMTLEDPDIKEEGVRVIETYKNKPRIMPEWKFIESIPELEEIINNEPKEMSLYDLGEKGKYLVFPTDNISDTIHNLLKMREIEKNFVNNNIKKFYFPQISNDTYNMAETVLKGCLFDTEYRVRRKRDDKEKIRYKNREE